MQVKYVVLPTSGKTGVGQLTMIMLTGSASGGTSTKGTGAETIIVCNLLYTCFQKY